MPCKLSSLLAVSALAMTALPAEADAQAGTQSDDDLARRVDAYIDERCEGTAAATAALLAALAAAGRDDPAAIEALLRAPRAEYPDAGELIGRTTLHDVTCYHVDYASQFGLYVPAGYDQEQATPLLIVGHGGNSSMSPARAARVAAAYLQAYRPLADAMDAILAAPHSSRGWGHIGNSLLLSTISQVQRRLHIDPDRVYVTGHSMGGHMTWRAALTLGDRWAAVSPHSGGYDYVDKGSIGNLLTVPGYATWGAREPYGIRDDNRTNAAWAAAHGLDWRFVEKPGGHEIYADEFATIARFFAARPRDLYGDAVYLRLGGAMRFVRTWQVEGWPEHEVRAETRPLRWNLRHWLEVTPRPEVDGPLTAHARYLGDNQFAVTCDQVRELSLHLHPQMIDFDADVVVTINGQEQFRGRVAPDPGHMLATVREFDDRGRVFWARLTIAVDSDRTVPLPGAPR